MPRFARRRRRRLVPRLLLPAVRFPLLAPQPPAPRPPRSAGIAMPYQPNGEACLQVGNLLLQAGDRVVLPGTRIIAIFPAGDIPWLAGDREQRLPR